MMDGVPGGKNLLNSCIFFVSECVCLSVSDATPFREVAYV